MKPFTHVLISAVLFILLVSPVISQQEHEAIVEEVSVNWWQVPVFALDKAGNPVMDLEPGDIEVIINENSILNFSLEKRTFGVTEQGQGAETVPAAAEEKPALPKKKVIVLLFDRALSSTSATRMAKTVAQKIIAEAEEDTRFYLMTIDAFAGLVYKGEGSGRDKDSLHQLVRQKVLVKPNFRIAAILSALDGLEKDDLPFLKESYSKLYTRQVMGVFSAFDSLYFFLNSIEDHKFVYLFSEGISRSFQARGRSLAGAKGQDNYYLKRAADSLSRCGAVLFIINAMGVLQYQYIDVLDSNSPLSGEESLHFLVKESGGSYMEGTPEKIAQRLSKMHRAYYEVSFPDAPQFKGSTRKIRIDAKRKGITIYSLHSLEEKKQYADMKPLEKNMLVLNLVSMPGNSLIKEKLNAYNAQVEKTQKNPKNISYTVTLPPSYLNKHIDLYKVWVAVDDQGAAQLEKIAEESLYPKKDKIKIEFALSKDKKEKKEKNEVQDDQKDQKSKTVETRAYFVLINKDAHPLKASVYGSGYYQEDPELEALAEAHTPQKNKSGKTISPEEMNNILQGAAEYCENIKQSAFHFYCQEKIVETQSPLSEPGKTQIDKDIDEKNIRGWGQVTNSLSYTNVKSYEFGYRLIKQGSNIKEERDLISSSDDIEVNPEQVITTNTFFSQKAIFAPITLLDRSRQGNYNYEFVDFAQYQDRPVVIIEALPKDPGKSIGVYGKIWIDTEDFSVLKIDADPRSIRGYDILKNLAEKLQTKLYLSLESEFHAVHNGIRLPTQVSILEKYKGGRLISEFRGPKGWERTRTEFTYAGYQFFDVQTDVTTK